MMDVKVQIEIVAIVGIISAVALLKGQAELATAGVGGLIGFLGANQLKETA